MALPLLLRNVLAASVSFVGATAWTKLLSHFVVKGTLSPYVARKVMHISTAPLFTSTWPLYSQRLYPHLFAAFTPISFAIRIFLNPSSNSLVRAVARSKRQQRQQQQSRHAAYSDSNSSEGGNSESETRAMASGPMTYGFSVGLLSIIGWISPATYIAVAALCFGDGMADVIGSKLNMYQLPLPKHIFYKKKSLPGTLAFFLSTIVTSCAWLRLPFFVAPHVRPASISFNSIVAISGVSAIAELLPFEDNLTVPLVAFVLGRMFSAPSLPMS